jgi:hypothetical protein
MVLRFSHPKNASFAISFTLSGIVTEFKEEQCPNIKLPIMLVTLFGIVTEVKDLQL